jgi:hypothetical protein
MSDEWDKYIKPKEEERGSLIKALQKVIKDWDIIELLLMVGFFPWSLIYLVFRVLQEWE